MKTLSTRAIALVCATLLIGCGRQEAGYYQGYIEGEYVLIASSVAGQLQELAVERGTRVEKGALLYTLDPEPEQTAVQEAAATLASAESILQDLEKGKRPSEIAALQANLEQARAAAEYSGRELQRAQSLANKDVVAKEQFDLARSTHDQNLKRIAQVEADIQTAKLGSREDQIAAARGQVIARKAVLAQAEWKLSQKKQFAPRSGLIFDTLYRPGEWIAAGKPVISLLPPENVRARFYVPQESLSSLHPDQKIRIKIDGKDETVEGFIDYVSPEAEYTPPVIFSRETRSKLVFRIEAHFTPDVAAQLNPGQPIEVYPEKP